MTRDEGEEPAADALRVVHHHPGRLRLRSDTFLSAIPGAEIGHDEAHGAHAARAALGATPGVLSVDHHGKTGSLLVEYDPARVTAQDLLTLVARASGLRSTGHRTPPAHTQGQRLLDLAREMNAAIYELTDFRVDMRTLVPASLACVSAVTFLLGKGGRVPRWDSLAYWSVSLLIMFNPREAAPTPQARPPTEQGAR